MAARALVIWAGILLLAMLNGLLREAFLIPALGMAAGQLLSGVTLSALILVVTYLTLPWLGARCTTSLLAIGLGWLVLTLIFEFSLGLYQGKSRAALLEAYRFREGNIWPVVLAVVVTAPLVSAWLRKRAATEGDC